MDVKIFNNLVFNYLNLIKSTEGKNNKLFILKEMLDYIIIKKDIFDLDYYKAFRSAIREKILEFSNDGYDLDKYMKLLFSDGKIDVEPIIVTEILQPTFEDYETHVFSGLYYDLNFEDSIIKHISDKYEIEDKTLILNMLKHTYTVLDVWRDNKIPDGPFLIKLNEHSYELYEKKSETVVSEGYFSYFNTTYTYYRTKPVGRYCKMSIKV